MKKLNKLKIYTIIMLASTIITACNILEVEPKIIVPENFYTSEKAVIYGLAGIYGVLNNENVYGRVYSMILSGADDLTYQNRQKGVAAAQWFTHSSGNEEVYNTWKWLYAGIKNANEFIPAITETEFDKNGLYIAEAKFLRAYYHFLLTQAWGDIPLRKEKIISPTETQLAATPQKDVLIWCANEMERAWNVFDRYYASEEGASENILRNAPSRITKHSIEGILARVYLFMAGEPFTDLLPSKPMYAKVMEWTSKVIDNSQVELNPDYSQIFINMIEDKYDQQYYESMWEADFIGNRESAQMWSNGRVGDIMGLQSTASDNKYGEWNCNFSHALYNGSLKLWDLYATEDRTDEDIITNIRDVRQLWNLPPYNYKGNTSGINGTKYKPSYEKTPYTVKSEDGRSTLTSFLMVDNAGKMEMVEQGVAVVNRNVGKWRRETVYEKQMTAKTLNTSINFPILRYADVLLMYAEAVNEYFGAPTQKAYDCLKEVRDRAKIETPSFSEVGNHQAFQDMVRNERGRELAFEAIRKYDLIRWGIFTEAMKGYLDYASRTEYKNNAEFGRGIETSYNIQEKHIYLPIPSTELSVNKLLNQNTLW